jgi:hypothetical protein
MELDKPFTREFYLVQHKATEQFYIAPSVEWTDDVLDARRFPTGEEAEAFRSELCRRSEEFRRTPDTLQVVQVEVTVKYLRFRWERL